MAKTMKRSMVRFHNADTDEIIDREMNDEEFAQFNADKVSFDAQAQQLQDKENAKNAVLERLGITSEEAAALLG